MSWRYRKCWSIGIIAVLAHFAVAIDSTAPDQSIKDGKFIDSEALEAIHKAVHSATDNSFLPSIPPTDELWYPRDDNEDEEVQIKRLPFPKKYEFYPIIQSSKRNVVKKHVKYTQMTEMIQSTLNHLLIILLVLPPFVLLYIVIPFKLLLGLKMNALASAFAMGAMSGYMVKKNHKSDDGGGTTLQQLQSFIISSGFPFWFPMLLNSAGLLGGVGHTTAVNKKEEKVEEQVEEQLKDNALDYSHNETNSYIEHISEESDEPPINLRRTLMKRRKFKKKRLRVI